MANLFFKNSIKNLEIHYKKEGKSFCTIGKEPFNFIVEIAFAPNQSLFDYIQLDKAIDQIATEPCIVETLTEKIFNICMKISPLALAVKVSATTEAHSPVTCTKRFMKGVN